MNRSPNTEDLEVSLDLENEEKQEKHNHGKPKPHKDITPYHDKATSQQKEAIVRFIDYLIDHLTFRRIALLTILGAFTLLLYSTYEHRDAIVQSLLSHVVSSSVDRSSNNITDWVLSDESKKSIRDFTESNPILFTAVTEVNLKRNTRKVHFTYMHSEFPESLNKTKIDSESKIVHTVFDYDARNTTQMVSVLANEFRCDPFIDTSYYRALPEASEHIKTVCRIAIPPFVGKFIGFLSVGIKEDLTKQELDSIRLTLSRIAVDIYLRDIEKKPQ